MLLIGLSWWIYTWLQGSSYLCIDRTWPFFQNRRGLKGRFLFSFSCALFLSIHRYSSQSIKDSYVGVRWFMEILMNLDLALHEHLWSHQISSMYFDSLYQQVQVECNNSKWAKGASRWKPANIQFSLHFWLHFDILIVYFSFGSLRIRQALRGIFCNSSSGCKTPVKYNCKKYKSYALAA